MSDRSFVDTNVLVYLFSNDADKQRQSDALLVSAPRDDTLVISTQVLGEFVNVCLRRGLLTAEETVGVLEVFIGALEVSRIEPAMMQQGLRVRQRYGYSWWDSLLLATALAGDCSVFYSEDMQAGQVIEGRMRIVNPFAGL